ncbi:MAG: Fe-S protein assembly co-chaperone HscB [Pseudomonadota bacterium]
MNYFDLFQIEMAFDIDLEKLRTHYQKLQRLTHPDKFASASDAQKRMYMQKNAQINYAYHVLLSPVSRTEHILQLRNYPLPDANASLNDTEFLMQQMELRDAMSQADTANALDDLTNVIDSQQNAIEKHISESLAKNETASNQNAASALTKLKFFTKLRSELEEKRLGA